MANTDVSPRLETRVGRDFPPEAAEQVIALLQTVPDIHSASRQDAERLQLFDFIADCEKDATAKIDVFAYDLDEPDIIAAICRIGKQGRLRAVLDNADCIPKPTRTPALSRSR